MNLETAIKITKGNQHAAMFLVDFINFCHLLDDVVDEVESPKDERLVKESLNLISHFCLNPWVKENAVLLFPLITIGFNAWPDSNRMAASGQPNQQMAADVVKGIYHEVVYFTAYLCGGHEHMREVSFEREYDYEYRPKEVM